MKRNHSAQTPVSQQPVRLVDVGPRIEFLPEIKRFDWNRLQRQLPSIAVSALSLVLVAHLTVGSGATLVPAAPELNATTATVSLAQQTDLQLIAAIENSLSAEQLGAESLLLSRSRSDADVLASETITPTESLASLTDESTPSEPADHAPASPEPEPTEPTVTEPVPTTAATTAPTTAPTAAPTAAPAAVKASAPVAVDSDSALSAAQQQEIIELCRSLIGVPYVYSGTSPSGLDCSGFTLYIYRELFGITLPHKSSDQTQVGTGVAKSDARVGDILCFDWDYDGTCDHVAIYIGNDHYVNASRSRGKVAEQVANFDKDPIIAVRRLIN